MQHPQSRHRAWTLISLMLFTMAPTGSSLGKEVGLLSVDPLAPGSDENPIHEEQEEDWWNQRPFSAGTWTVVTYGSASFGDENGEIYAAHIGMGYHPWDNISINVEAFGGHLDFEEGDLNEATAIGT